uniref:Uncharacterized protein n=1 Tax=Stomoxys calcitrans TaxID=35570 RepID=A0A1I8NVS1_STOCA
MKFYAFFVVLLLAIFNQSSLGLPLRDSPINTIVIPYEPYISQKVFNGRGELKRVLVPINMDIVPRGNLKKGQLGMGKNGVALNFAEGAYPVYYMPSSVNGKFNGKISLLV